MKVQADTIEEFFEAAGERESEARRLDEIVRQSAPELERTLFKSSSMTAISYGMYHYKYASGAEGDWPLVCLAVQKNHLSMYVCALNDDGSYVAESYAGELGNIGVGKSCIRIKRVDDVNLEALQKVLKEAAAWKARQK